MTQPITINPDIQKLLELPDCKLLSLPKPVPAKLRLPGGGQLSAFTDISKGIPTDCTMSFSLVMQLAPMLASIECLVKVLGLLKPLIDIISGLPAPPGPQVLLDFGKAAEKVMGCITAFTPTGGLLLFIKDIILLICSFLNCFIGQLSTIIGLLSGIALQMQFAEEAGNEELQRVLKCAQDNAMTSADHLQGAIGPVINLVSLVEPLLGLADIKIQTPSIVPGADLEGMRAMLQSLQDLVDTLQQIAEGIPG
jgi:hypothetical protein